MLNVRSVLGHDAVVGCSTVLSPGADINSRARTGRASFLGAGAIMHPKSELWAFRCLVPAFDSVIFSHQWKDALWDRFCTEIPPRDAR